MPVEALGAVVVQALELAFWLSLPALLASAVAGALSGMLQGATQVQDPALGFVPRLLAVAAALVLSAGWMGERLMAFTAQLFGGLAP
jgi:type III secretory pathway component EscS